MSKKIIYTILFTVLLITMSISPVLAQSDSMMEEGVMEMDGMMMGPDGRMQMTIDMGPALGGQMAHVYVDLVAFVISLYLVMKIGRGKIRNPIMLLGLGFLVSALIPLFFGHQFMWLIALVKSIAATFAMIWFMSVFGLLKKAPTSSNQ